MDSKRPEAEENLFANPVTEDAGDVPWPWESTAHPEGADPFSLLTPISGSAARQSGAPESTDVLEQLKGEAEAVLRDPDYVSAYAAQPGSGAASTWARPTKADPNPLQTLARSAASDDSLMDMLDAEGHLDALIGTSAPLDGKQFYAIAPAPDVLRLFAGDIAPTPRREVTAPLTRREHHLISMDSAYRPAQAQRPGYDHDA